MGSYRGGRDAPFFFNHPTKIPLTQEGKLVLLAERLVETIEDNRALHSKVLFLESAAEKLAEEILDYFGVEAPKDDFVQYLNKALYVIRSIDIDDHK